MIIFYRSSDLRHASYEERRGGRSRHNVNSAWTVPSNSWNPYSTALLQFAVKLGHIALYGSNVRGSVAYHQVYTFISGTREG